MKFHKYQALGNDYIVLETTGAALDAALVRRVCDRHRGLCADNVTVSMPGGALQIGISTDFHVTMLEPVGKVADGVLAPELLAA